MLSDEEKAVLKTAKENYGLTSAEQKILVNLIEKQSKEIEELSDKLTEKICKGVEEEILEEYRQTIISKDKEIEELKEDKYGLEEEVQMQAKNIMLCENALYEIQDKIKAKIEENKWAIEHYDCDEADYKQSQAVGAWNVLQRLLEKE